MDRNMLKVKIALGALVAAVVVMAVAMTIVVASPADYDADESGYLDRSEAKAALEDYRAGALTADEALDVVTAYVRGTRVTEATPTPSPAPSTCSFTDGKDAIVWRLKPEVRVDRNRTFVNPAGDWTYGYMVEWSYSGHDLSISVTDDREWIVAIRIGGQEEFRRTGSLQPWIPLNTGAGDENILRLTGKYDLYVNGVHALRVDPSSTYDQEMKRRHSYFWIAEQPQEYLC